MLSERDLGIKPDTPEMVRLKRIADMEADLGVADDKRGWWALRKWWGVYSYSNYYEMPDLERRYREAVAA